MSGSTLNVVMPSCFPFRVKPHVSDDFRSLFLTSGTVLITPFQDFTERSAIISPLYSLFCTQEWVPKHIICINVINYYFCIEVDINLMLSKLLRLKIMVERCCWIVYC